MAPDDVGWYCRTINMPLLQAVQHSRKPIFPFSASAQAARSVPPPPHSQEPLTAYLDARAMCRKQPELQVPTAPYRKVAYEDTVHSDRLGPFWGTRMIVYITEFIPVAESTSCVSPTTSLLQWHGSTGTVSMAAWTRPDCDGSIQQQKSGSQQSWMK